MTAEDRQICVSAIKWIVTLDASYCRAAWRWHRVCARQSFSTAEIALTGSNLPTWPRADVSYGAIRASALTLSKFRTYLVLAPSVILEFWHIHLRTTGE